MFTTVINNYARELNILKEKDVNFTGADVRNGMTAVISIKHPDPRFEGQTKTKLDNQDAAKVVAKVTGDEIQHYFDRNLEVLKAVIGCAEKAAKIRKTEEKAKTNMLTKQKFSFDSNGKLANCESRGMLQNARFSSWREILQAVLPRRPETECIRPSCQFGERF